MEYKQQEAIFKTLASDTRLRIMDLLVSEMQGLRFNQIAKALDIHPSTLEDHLKRLVRNDIIAHRDYLYLSTLNTIRFTKLAGSASSSELSSYMSKHTMPIEDEKILSEFWNLDFTLMPDLLTIIRKAQESFSEVSNWGFLGGAMNIRLEKSFFELWEPDFQNVSIEAVFTENGIKDIIELKIGNLFFQAIDPGKISLYTIPECNWAVAGNNSGGFLFLPNLSSEVDYTQCLCFETKEGIDWLVKVFNYLKSKASKLSKHEIRKIIQ